MKKNRILGSSLMLTASLIWGAAFVAQSIGMDSVGPFTFSAVRILLGALTLLPVILIKDGYAKRKAPTVEKRPFFNKRELFFGGMMGLAFFVACNFQQYALAYTTPGKAAFITAMYIVFVPIAGIFMKKKVSPLVWASVALAFVGLYFLCVSPTEGGLNIGDVLAFAGSLFFTVQILLIERSGEEVDGVKLSFLQFLVCGILSACVTVLVEKSTAAGIWDAVLPLLYAGVLSGGVAYTFQIIAQKNLDTTVASLLMSMESVFAVLTAWLFMQQSLSVREGIGCAVMLAAIVLAQTADKLWQKEKERNNGEKEPRI